MIEARADRLKLVALDARLAGLQTHDPAAFFAALNVQPEASWPPDLMDRTTLKWTEEQLKASPGDAGWYFWAFIWPDFVGYKDRLVGGGGFKGPPDEKGVVKTGYSMLHSFREQGLATEAVRSLIGWAFSTGQVREVIAETLPHLMASRRVLEKSGFVETGTREEDGVKIIRFGLQRKRAAA